jgi:hypothetical protein
MVELCTTLPASRFLEALGRAHSEALTVLLRCAPPYLRPYHTKSPAHPAQCTRLQCSAPHARLPSSLTLA